MTDDEIKFNRPQIYAESLQEKRNHQGIGRKPNLS